MRKVVRDLLTAPLLTVCDNRYGRGEILEVHAAIGMAAAMLSSVHRAMISPAGHKNLLYARTDIMAMSELRSRTRASEFGFLNSHALVVRAMSGNIFARRDRHHTLSARGIGGT